MLDNVGELSYLHSTLSTAKIDMMKFLKRPLGIVVILITVVVAGIIFFVTRDGGPEYEFVVAGEGNIIQEVSVTGRVKATESVELAFEKIGRVSNVFVDIGDMVQKGDLLIILDKQELIADLAKAEANLTAEQASLAELEKGARPEEIQAAQTKVENAETSLQDAEGSLLTTTQKAAADLENVYAGGVTASQKAVNAAKNSLLVITDIQFMHFLKNDQRSLNVAEAKAVVVLSLFGETNGGKLNTESLGRLMGGTFGVVQDLRKNSQKEGIDQAISDTSDILGDAKTALAAVPIITDLSTTERSDLATEKSAVDTEIVSLSDKQQAIAVQKAQNASVIASAQTTLNDAKNVLATVQDELVLKEAGATPEQIAEQTAKVHSSVAEVQSIEAKIAKTQLRSPIAGVVTKQEAKIGEIVGAGDLVVSVISEAKFEIKTQVPEADIAKIVVGDTAETTLDAYTSDVVFPTKVVMIDPAETIIEGVPTYTVTLQFEQGDDRIKSGMTANTDIVTASKEDVLIIPQRAVITNEGQKIVRLLINGNVIEEVVVQTGLRGSDGNIEIVEGITEGDRVVIFIRER